MRSCATSSGTCGSCCRSMRAGARRLPERVRRGAGAGHRAAERRRVGSAERPGEPSSASAASAPGCRPRVNWPPPADRGPGSPMSPGEPGPTSWPSGGGRYGLVSTALNRKDATAPFASSGALELVLHWPFFGPDLYLGPNPAKRTCTAPGPEVPANLPVLLLPTAVKTTYVANEKWQAFTLECCVLVGLAVTTTASFPAEVADVWRWPFLGPVPPPAEKTPRELTSPRPATGMMGLFAVARLPWMTP